MYTEQDTRRLLIALTKQARALNKYKIYYTGQSTKYGVSIVYAENEQDAKKKANIHKDSIWKVEQL